MNFPLKGDLDFLKNLKKGDPLYLCEAEWNSDNGHTDLKVKTIYFDHYDDRPVGALDEEENPVFAVLSDKKGGIQTGVHDLRYGFYETPLLALQSLQTYYAEGLEAANKAIDKEKAHLEKVAKKKQKK